MTKQKSHTRQSSFYYNRNCDECSETGTLEYDPKRDESFCTVCGLVAPKVIRNDSRAEPLHELNDEDVMAQTAQNRHGAVHATTFYARDADDEALYNRLHRYQVGEDQHGGSAPTNPHKVNMKERRKRYRLEGICNELSSAETKKVMSLVTNAPIRQVSWLGGWDIAVVAAISEIDKHDYAMRMMGEITYTDTYDYGPEECLERAKNQLFDN